MKNLKLLWMLAISCSLVFVACDDDHDHDEPYIPEEDTSVTITFESASLLESGYIYNESYTESGVTFNNVYNASWDTWYGFAISNLHDKVTAGYTNQYSVYGDGGADGSSNFAVCFNSSEDPDVYFAFESGVSRKLISVMVTSATYAALSILEGDAYSKKFNTEDQDWFKMTFTGYDISASQTGTVDFYLADFRDGKSYVCDEWTSVDLSPLGNVNMVTITFTSTDNGAWGMNTPGYGCLDNLKYDLAD